MKVVIMSRTEEEIERCDYRDAYMVMIDGEQVFSVYDDEPEDSNMGRSFSDVYSIGHIMELAYNAGKNGEEFLLEEVQTNDI